MIKRLQVVLIIIILLSCAIIPVAYGHGSQKEHDDELFAVLFGDGYNLASDKKPAFQAIADAAALCIDQFSTNEDKRSKEGLFNDLKSRVGFSMSFDDIELLNGKDGMRVSARTHRRYTHRGWNFSFTLGSDEQSKDEQSLLKSEQKLWVQRKKILTATVNKELFGKASGFLGNFHFLEGSLYSEEACNEQCEAFCLLVYNVHILGDYLEADSYSAEFQQLIPLARHEDPNSPAMIRDIINALPDLFPNQKNSYQNLIQNLQDIEAEADQILNAWGGIRTQEQFDAYHACAEKLLELLKEQIPGLLKNEEFFSNAFYK